jgi:hypothetical protein
MIKLITGFSGMGGSTIALINLCNALNSIGHESRMYGPHNWFLSHCKSDHINNLKINEDDRIIVHFINSKNLPKTKRSIFSIHEKALFPLKDSYYTQYEYIHYVSQPQKDYHKVEHPNFILPNLLDNLIPSENKPIKIAGIIGSIDRNKNVHESIIRAIRDGMNKILIYGAITDGNYFKLSVEPLIKKFKGKIEVKGIESDKQKIYNSVSDVYSSSLSEVWGYIERECELTNTIYHGNEATKNNFNIKMSNSVILENWVNYLGLGN